MDGIDTQLAVVMLIAAGVLAIWGAAAHLVQRSKSKPGNLRRHADQVIRDRGLTHLNPQVTLYPDNAHALVTWTEQGQARAVLITLHHMLDHDHDQETHP